MRNAIQFKVSGEFALFTDPLTKIGGEKFSYPIPTYQALKGIVESVYFKPTLTWRIHRMRVMKPIRTQSRSAKPLHYGGGSDLAIYTYLADVEYRVEASFTWNMNRPDLAHDRNEHKHHNIAKRMVERGGRRDVFLGTRECQAYVEPCDFDEGAGYYDSTDKLTFGLMFHGFDYPDETGRPELWTRFWEPEMQQGVVQFCEPDSCNIRKYIKPMRPSFIQTSGADAPELLEEDV